VTSPVNHSVQFQQANERLRQLDLQRLQGQISPEAYREERQEIIRYLNQEQPSDTPLPEHPSEEPTRSKWWWNR
jgi:hypothetical protein